MSNLTKKPVNKAKSTDNPKMPIKLLPFGMAMRWYRKIYNKNGFKTLPLSRATLGDSKTGKTPLTPHGYKDATADDKIFNSFLKPHQEHNIGIATGLSSGIIVLDIDRRNGGFISLETLEREYGKLPPTPTVITGDGEHRYFICPPQGLKSGVLAQGIDLMADSKYVAAPPSLHHTGVIYRWKTLPRNNACFSNLPIAWLKCFMTGKGQKSVNDPVETILEGKRNDALTSLAGKLVRQGLSKEDILERLKSENLARCVPPLTSDEVEKIASSIENYRKSESLGDAERVIASLQLQHYDGEGIKYCIILQSFYIYNGKYWVVFSQAQIHALCLEECENLGFYRKTRALSKEVAELLQYKQTTTNDFFRIQSEPHNVINCQNGEVWLGQNGQISLKPHNLNSGLRHILPVDYDPEAICPEFDKALYDIFRNHVDIEVTIDFIAMLIGYIIQSTRPVALAVIFHGKGSNGKSKLIEVIEALLGRDGFYSGSLADLEKNRFLIGSLNRKFLFVDDDLKAGSRLPDGEIKKISEGKLLTGEEKHKNPFNFICRVVPLISCNNLPSTTDLSEGLKRRLLVVNFNHEFKGDEVDLHLFSRIIRHELAGVLNFALFGWRIFCENGQKFIQSCDMIKAKNDFLAQANPLLTFIEDECQKNHFVPLDSFYKAYTQWVTESGIKGSQTKQSVRKNLEHQGFNITRKGAGMRIEGLSLKK